MLLNPRNRGTIDNKITQKRAHIATQTVQETLEPQQEKVCILLTLFIEEGHSPVFHGGEVVHNFVIEIPFGLQVLHNY